MNRRGFIKAISAAAVALRILPKAEPEKLPEPNADYDDAFVGHSYRLTREEFRQLRMGTDLDAFEDAMWAKPGTGTPLPKATWDDIHPKLDSFADYMENQMRKGFTFQGS